MLNFSPLHQAASTGVMLSWIERLWADEMLEMIAEISQPFSLPLPTFLREVFHDNEH
jgi:hypothetical protein